MSGAVEGVALAACPFCGGSQVRVVTNTQAAMSWVSCPSCGLEAPSETGVSAEQAVTYWNTRTTPPARSYADAIKDAAKVADAGLAEWNKIVAAGGVIVAGISITEEEAHVAAGACEALAAAIRLLSQGGKA